MASYGKDLLRIERSPFATKHILNLPIIETRHPAGHYQERLIADAETDRLAICVGSTLCTLAASSRSKSIVGLDDFKVPRVRLREGAHCFNAHRCFAPSGPMYALPEVWPKYVAHGWSSPCAMRSVTAMRDEAEVRMLGSP